MQSSKLLILSFYFLLQQIYLMQQSSNFPNRLKTNLDFDVDSKPKILRRYLNTNNPTLKSDHFISTIMQNDSIDINSTRKQLVQDYRKKMFLQRHYKKADDQLDLATKQFLNKKTNKNYEEHLKNQQISVAQENPQNENMKGRSKSVASIMKLYVNNDQGIFVKQSKPFNIISGQTNDIKELRKYPKLTNEYKLESQSNRKSIYPFNIS